MWTTEPLTEQEQQALDQMRRAQEQGSTLQQLAPTMCLRRDDVADNPPVRQFI